ncbi:MAG: glycosyltransferase family 2 protein [Acidobacteriota bacterium]
MSVVLWVSLALIVYIYAGYPLAAAVLGRLIPRRVASGPYEPTVTIVIAAFNEADVIASTLENKLALEYPPELLEILVVSDGSEDGTDAIVQRFATERVRLIRQEPRAGKTSALNLGVQHVRSEIVVFSDANSIYRVDALRNLVRGFADPRVGYVTGKMLYGTGPGDWVGSGCSAFMKYENFLRVQETRLGSVVGVDGGIDAVRRALYLPMRSDQLPDFVLPLSVVEQGYRVVFEPDAIVVEDALSKGSDEYRMRVRVALRAFWALWDKRSLFNPFRRPLFAWQLLSHKLLRYLALVPMLTAFAANLILASKGPVYAVLLLLQLLVWAGALFGLTPAARMIPIGIVRWTSYLLLLNVASLHAFLRFMLGKKQVLWTPRKG